MKSAVVLMGLALCTATAARAELIVRFEQRRLSGEVATEADGEVALGHDRIACGLDAVKGTPPPPRFVYRGDLQVLWTIQPLWTWYSQEDSVTASAARSMHKNDPHEEAEARILQQPAAERARAEAEEQARRAAEAAAAAAAAAVPLTAAADVSETIAGVRCVRWDAAALHADGTQPEWRLEVWVAPWDAVGITADECAAALDMGRTFERWWRGTPADGRLVSALRALPQLGGFPVRIRQFHAGMLTAEYTFTAAKRQDVTPGLFVLPPGFARREG
jgi:hypothetical protein